MIKVKPNNSFNYLMAFVVACCLLLVGKVQADRALPDPSPIMSELYRVVMDTRIKQGVLELVEQLVDAGEDVNYVLIGGKNSIESYVLNKAISRQYYELVKYLIDSGAIVNPVFKNGCTPISIAESYDGEDSQRIIKLLIDSGADLTRPTCYRNRTQYGEDRSAIRRLMYSYLLEEDTKLYVIEAYHRQNNKFSYSSLPLIGNVKNAKLIKKIVELQPTLLEEVRYGTTVREMILKSKHESIRAIVSDN